MAGRSTTSRKKTTAAKAPARKAPVASPAAKASARETPVASPLVTEYYRQGLEQMLTFVIGNDEYGISILRVREIVEYRPLTPVPMTPPWMRGVMNLRGIVVPVVDLGGKLGLGSDGSLATNLSGHR